MTQAYTPGSLSYLGINPTGAAAATPASGTAAAPASGEVTPAAAINATTQGASGLQQLMQALTQMGQVAPAGQAPADTSAGQSPNIIKVPAAGGLNQALQGKG